MDDRTNISMSLRLAKLKKTWNIVQLCEEKHGMKEWSGMDSGGMWRHSPTPFRLCCNSQMGVDAEAETKKRLWL